ncbi:hypothetical protein Q5P01_016530 [Channa striata]|uniref:Cadherin domain-containing protein n=1 Tax=Channa striata TaxID=64152 RepID=A0AA88MGC8_CHASR|nr:hypothetical protein Q5P01_016530 [Channa striata]
MIRVCWPVFVLLLFALQAVAVVRANFEDNLVRKRREWIPPPKQIPENVDWTNMEYVAKIHSDFDDNKGNIFYSLEGIGANQYPFHVFVVHPKTGFIRVTQILDRELIDTYNLSGVAKYNNGNLAEKNIDIRFKVTDENDNPPIFGVISPGQVDELSPVGTSVMNIVATDADEPGNKNSLIAYSIINQNPPNDMFSITRNGTICVNKANLDREALDLYTLTVKAQDLNGEVGGHSATTTVVINIQDVNDNPPILEKEQYEGNIMENTQGVEVMRLKANDRDMEGTDNWDAVYDIVKGNEAGYFSIRTDPVTNEGILMLDKAVDYEDVKNLELGIAVRNKAPPYSGHWTSTGGSIGEGRGGGGGGGGGGGSWALGGGGGTASGAAGGSSSWQSVTPVKTYPVKINVTNQPEGPRFDPKVKAFPISEGGQTFNIKDVIGRYPAIDGDTGKPAENVRYAKGLDPDNWLTIDPKTAEIRLNKMPDRESKFLVNGTYTAKVLCISDDMPDKTATGTIAIQVEDFNDHCPTLTSNVQSMCTTDDAVIVNAVDEDTYPNGPPFDFAIIPEGTQGKWQVEHLNDTAAILRAQEPLWPGYYEVEFLVKDEQGESCPEPQKVKVQVCTCEKGVMCGQRGANGQSSKKSELGPAGIGLLLLGLLLLLLIPLLLLFCLCGDGAALPGNFTEMPFDTKSHLINYHTEGQGENTEVPLLTMPTQADADMVNAGMGMNRRISGMVPIECLDFRKSVTSIDGMNRAVYQGLASEHGEGLWGTMNRKRGSGFYQEGVELRESGGIFDSMALPDHLLRNYYTEKTMSGNENLTVKDSLLVYDNEGQGSPAGSVGCCSLLESENDLQFLDDLGPKFKTLAEVCGGKSIPTEVKQVSTSLPSVSINTQTSVSSVVSPPQLPPQPKMQQSVTKTEDIVVKKTSERSQVVNESKVTAKGGITTVKQGMGNQGQMVLLQQQPVYYSTTAMLQPVHYVVQPQVQNTLLVAEAPATNLQGMVLVNGTQTVPAQGIMLQGQTVISSGQAHGPGMVLAENSRVQGAASNLIHSGKLSGSQTMHLMEGKVPAGSLKTLKGSQTGLLQGGTLQAGGLSGSQRALVVGGSASNEGQLVQEAGSLSQMSSLPGSQKVLCNMSSMLPGSHSNVMGSSSTTISTTPTYHKVVMQETRETF